MNVSKIVSGLRRMKEGCLMYTLVPFRRAMSPMFNDHFMRDFFDGPAMPEMRVDVQEKEDAYLLEADLPGVKKEDIRLDVQDGVLTISADVNTHKEEQKEGYVCSERRSGHVERSFSLEGIDLTGIAADYQSGVLSVTLPKEKKEEKPNSLRIHIGDGSAD